MDIQRDTLKSEIEELRVKLTDAKKLYSKTLIKFIEAQLETFVKNENSELKKISFIAKKFYTHAREIPKFSKDLPETDIIDIFWASENNNYSNQILFCDKDTATVINTSNKKIVNNFKLQGQDLKTCAIEPTQNGLIAVGGIEGQVYVGEINSNNSYRKEDNSNIKKHTGHQGAVNSIRFLDHFFMISGSSDSLILLWDLNSQGKYLSSYHDHSSEILGLDVCELNPNFFASASGDTTVKLWDIRDKKPCISTFKGSDSSVNCVKFVPGTFCSLAAGSEEGVIRLYDMRAYGVLAEYGKKDEKNKKINNSINSICFSKSGQIIFSSSNNSNIITYWNLFNPQSPLNEYEHNEGNLKSGIKQMVLNSAGDTLAYAVKNSLYFLK